MSWLKIAYYILRGIVLAPIKKKKSAARPTAELNTMSLRMYVEDNLERLVAKVSKDGLKATVDLMVDEIPNFFKSGTYEPLHLLLRDTLRKEGHIDSALYDYADEIVKLLKGRGFLK
jgi:hypothetical protein